MNSTNTTGFYHPQYEEYYNQWVKLTDIQGGEDKIKYRNEYYLPMTPGMSRDYEDSATRKLAEQRYARYLFGAIFYNYFIDTALAMNVLMHSNPPDKIRLPESLKYLKSTITPHGDDINGLLSDLNFQQLVKGRVGILLDITDDGFSALQYNTINIINWDGVYKGGKYVLQYVLLREPSLVREGFRFIEVDRYRILALDENGDYYTATVDENQLADFDLLQPPDYVVYPQVRGVV